MTEEQAQAIHRAARTLVMHERINDLHPVDFQRFRLALWGDALDHRADNNTLLRMARVSAGMNA